MKESTVKELEELNLSELDYAELKDLLENVIYPETNFLGGTKWGIGMERWFQINKWIEYRVLLTILKLLDYLLNEEGSSIYEWNQEKGFPSESQIVEILWACGMKKREWNRRSQNQIKKDK